MKKPLAIGDRVRVYALAVLDAGDGTGVATHGPFVGKVIRVKDSGHVYVKDEDGEWIAHVKQCRRLKKKERRRVWVGEDDINARKGIVPIFYHWPGTGRLEFIEVRRPKDA